MGTRPLVLLTRPRDRATALAEDLSQMGVDCLIWPLLTVHPTLTMPVTIGDAQAILLTSARAAEATTAALDTPVFCVGDATASAAQAKGFRDVRSANGDAASLAALITNDLSPDDGPLLYLRGRDVARDMSKLLPGFVVKDVEVYHADAAQTVPDDVFAALSAQSLAAVAFFSPRTAAIFGQVIPEALRPTLSSVAAIAMSERVANEVNQMGFQSVTVAQSLDLAAMHAAICGACGIAAVQDGV